MISFGLSSQKQESKSTPVQLDLYSPEQQNIFRNLAAMVSSGMGGNVAAYPGNMYVPRQPEEEQYFQLANKVAGEYDTRLAALNNVLSGNAAYNINPDITKQYFESGIKPIMAREFYKTTMPALREAFTGPGYWSSARAIAEANATEKYGENLASTQANLVYADELARRASLESAANRQAGVALPAMEEVLQTVGTAGQYARSIKEEETLSNYQRWLAGETVNGVTPAQSNPFIQLAYQFLGLQPTTWGTQSTASGSGTGFNFGLSANLMK